MMLFLVAVGLLLNLVVPPFQNPDEPQHFGAIMIYARGEAQRAAAESDVVRMMHRNNWWKYLGMGTPVDPPEKLSDIQYLVHGAVVSDFRISLRNIDLYHRGMGKILHALGLTDTEEAYYFCRFISLLLILASMALAAAALKNIAGKNSLIVYVALLFIIFLPQFLMSLVAVNSDIPAIFISTLFFFCAVSLMREGNKLIYFGLLFMTAVLGFFTDRSTFFLLPLSLVLPFFLIRKEKYKDHIIYAVVFLMAFILFVFAFTSFFPQQAENSFALFIPNLNRVMQALPGLLSFNENVLKFLDLMGDTFLFKFGWVAFGTGNAVYFFWKVLVLLSIIGVGGYIGRFIYSIFKHKDTDSNRDPYIKYLLFFITAIVLELLAVWTYYGSMGVLAQGRHFYPLILPIAFLFMLGLKTLIQSVFPAKVPVFLYSLATLEFVFLNVCIWYYIVPVFHMAIKSPVSGL